ncbi:hypothetical protein Taro_036736 [Colocasia esculenta]|uniref:Uncharacterized protein n=1 Tax=Colocasia esculenta TaxID=4460 RepID=A0A843W976_COLES|nr:hypothetical protein [Colocasia esculenta]
MSNSLTSINPRDNGYFNGCISKRRYKLKDRSEETELTKKTWWYPGCCFPSVVKEDLVGDPGCCCSLQAMASCSRHGAHAREDEPRREERDEQQAPAPQGPTERADVWWTLLLRARFKDGAVEVAWDEFVRLLRVKYVPEHIQDKME